MSRDTIIYLRQNLGFIINIKTSISQPCQKIEFLGMEIDSVKMSFPLKPEKIKKAVKIFHNFARIHSTTLWKLIRVTGLLSFTI